MNVARQRAAKSAGTHLKAVTPGAAEAADTTAARIEAFLDRNGYTAREVRGIAREAILRWVSQKT